jgi:hypothetical protein
MLPGLHRLCLAPERCCSTGVHFVSPKAAHRAHINEKNVVKIKGLDCGYKSGALSNQECGICYQPFGGSGTKVYTNEVGNPGGKDRELELEVLECGHVFHTDCIIQWVVYGNNSTCPICRKTVSEPDIDAMVNARSEAREYLERARIAQERARVRAARQREAANSMLSPTTQRERYEARLWWIPIRRITMRQPTPDVLTDIHMEDTVALFRIWQQELGVMQRRIDREVLELIGAQDALERADAVVAALELRASGARARARAAEEVLGVNINTAIASEERMREQLVAHRRQMRARGEVAVSDLRRLWVAPSDANSQDAPPIVRRVENLRPVPSLPARMRASEEAPPPLAVRRQNAQIGDANDSEPSE